MTTSACASVLALALCVVGSQASASDYEVLNELLLDNLTLTIPDVTVDKMSAEDIVISDISILELDTEMYKAGRDGTLKVNLHFALSLDAVLNATVPVIGHIHGPLHVDFINGGPLTAIIDLSNPDLPFGVGQGDATKAGVSLFSVKPGDFNCSLEGQPESMCRLAVQGVLSMLDDWSVLTQGLGFLLTNELTKLNKTLTAYQKGTPTLKELVNMTEAPFTHFLNDADMYKTSEDSTAASVVDFVANDVYGHVDPQSPVGNTAIGELLADKLTGVPIPLAYPILKKNATLAGITLRKPVVTKFHAESVGNFSGKLFIQLQQSAMDAEVKLHLENGRTGFVFDQNATLKLTDVAVDLEVTFMVVANATQMGTLSIDSLLPLPKNMKMASLLAWVMGGHLIPCWVSHPLYGLNVTKIGATMHNFKIADDIISPPVGQDIAVLGDAALAFLPNTLNMMLNQNVTDPTTKLIDFALQMLRPIRPNPPNPCSVERYPDSNLTAPPSIHTNYSDSIMMDVVDFVVNKAIGDHGLYGIEGFLLAGARVGLPKVNKAIHFWNEHIGAIDLKIDNAQLVQTPSVSKFSVLNPDSSRWDLVNHLGLRNVNLSVDITYSLRGEPSQHDFSNTLRVYVGLHEMALYDILRPVLDTNRFLMSPLSELAFPGCAAANILDLGFPETQVSVDHFHVAVECLKCDSPLFVSQLPDALNSAEGRKELDQALQSALNQLPTLLNKDYTKNLISKALAKNAKECNSGVTPPPPALTATGRKDGPMTKTKAYLIVWGISGGLALILSIYAPVTHSKWRRELETKGEYPMSRSSHMPLLWHPSMGAFVRYLILALLLGTLAVFLSSNLPPIGIGAVVHAHVYLGGSLVKINHLFTYALANTISDMYNAKVYPLSFLVCLLSGVWPYSKMVGMIYAWVCPPSALGHRRRGQLLEFLDFFGKWSLIDSFMVMMMMCAFHLDIQAPPGWKFLPEGMLEFEIIVTPFWGLFGFMTAAILSLTINHAMVVLHRNSVLYDETSGACGGWFDDLSEGDCDRAHMRMVLARTSIYNEEDHAKDGEVSVEEQKKKQRNDMVRAGLSIVLLGVSLVLLILGVSVHTFEFDFEGLAAWGTDLYKPGSAHVEYSLVSLAKDVMDQASTTREHIEYLYLVIVFFIFTVAMPVIQVVLLLVLWLAPLTLREQKILYFTNEIVAAWNALDVFIVVLVATLLEIAKFAEFLIGDSCDEINNIMVDTVQPLGYLNNIEGKCFSVKSKLVYGCWVLFSASLASNLAYAVAHRSAEKLIAARQAQMESVMPLVDPQEDLHNGSLSKPPRDVDINAVTADAYRHDEDQ